MIKKIALFIYSYNVRLCLTIQRSCENKLLKIVMFTGVLPIMLLNMFFRIMSENTIGKIQVEIIKKREERCYFEDNLSIVAIAKNEGEYIEEWLAYYKSIGVNRVYLYENNGTDNMKEKIQPFLDSGFVIYHNFPGNAMQLPAYNHAIKNYGNRTKFMAMVDCDEFLMPTKNPFDLVSTVNEIFALTEHAGGIGVNWCVYGSSGKMKKEPGLLMERFKMRAKDSSWNNKLIKTIVDPRLVKTFVSPHFAIYKLGAWCIDTKGQRVRTWYINDVDYTAIRCNHFFCKSVEEFKNKQARGLADRVGVSYDMTKFNKYNVNDLEDNAMDRYIDGVWRIIQRGED